MYFSNESFKLIHADQVAHDRVVYVLVFEKGSYLKDAVNKVCSHFSGKIYQLPEDDQAGPQAYATLIKEVKTQLNQSDGLIKLTKQHLC